MAKEAAEEPIIHLTDKTTTTMVTIDTTEEISTILETIAETTVEVEEVEVATAGIIRILAIVEMISHNFTTNRKSLNLKIIVAVVAA